MRRNFRGNKSYYTYIIYQGDEVYYRYPRVATNRAQVWAHIGRHLKQFRMVGLRGVLLRFDAREGKWIEHRAMVSRIRSWRIVVGECPIQDRPLTLPPFFKESAA